MKSRGHRFAIAAHAALLALAFLIFAMPVGLPAGLAFGALATASGAILAERLEHKRVRLPMIALAALVGWCAFLLVAYIITTSAGIAGAIGPASALLAGDALRFGGLGFAAALLVRGAAIRFRAALALEGTLVVLAVATTVAEHRDSNIARPIEISDWFWTQGLDPVVAFLAIGLVGALLLAGVLAYGRSPGRTIAQLVVVLLIGVFLASQIYGRDVSEQREVIGAKGDKEREEAQKNSGKGGGAGDGKGNAKPPQDDMPRFNNGENRENKPAAIVVFHRGIAPAAGAFYFRTAAFSQWNGSRLIEATIGGVDPDSRIIYPSEKHQLEPTPQGMRELVANDIVLITEHPRLFALTDAIELEPMVNPDPVRFRRAYRVVSSVVTAEYDKMLGRQPGDPAWSDELWAHYTEVPRDERYHELAAQLKSDLRAEFADDPLAQAMVVKQWLEKNTTYSFSKNYDGEQDPTAAFLFSEEKKGYCVHTANAAAFLMRAMGLPTRVSAGYAVPAANLGGGSSLLIKSGDAHAWAELYLAGVGWVPIEVTPEKTDVEQKPFQEQDLQQLLGEMARKEGRESRDQAEGGFRLGPFLAAIREALPYVIAALLIGAYLAKLWRLILAPALANRRETPRVAYRAALDRLSAVGLVRNVGESRERFAQRTTDFAPSFGRLTAANVGVALGSRIERKLNEPLSPLAIGVAHELRKKMPWWRLLLGALNPISWLWSR